MSQLLVQGKVHAFLKKMQYLPEKVKEIRRAGPVWVLRKHAGFAPARQSLLGFRLRSPRPSVEEPCPLSLQTAFSPLCLRLSKAGVFSKHLAGAFDNHGIKMLINVSFSAVIEFRHGEKANS
jgi:hypothetical protein